MQFGSSPLSRGIRPSGTRRFFRPGIIPALAGNTHRHVEPELAVQDHPRSRGEYPVCQNMAPNMDGSSPLSRGIRGCSRRPSQRPGIIPALAGNTTRATPTPRFSKDHPRSRGEYGMRVSESVMIPGSSPLSRGIRGEGDLRIRRGRIIPALAGNTLVDKGFYQPDLSDLGNPLLARLRFSKSLAPRLRRPPSWRGGSSGSASEGPGRTIRVSPS